MMRAGSSKNRGRVVWDEQNLDFLEASKTPKQKINEPKTPYHHTAEAEDDAVHADAIRDALSEVASTSAADSSRRHGSGWTSSEDEAEEMDHESEGIESNGRRLSFEEQRRAHYDEYRKAKLSSGAEMSDEDTEIALEDLERQLTGGTNIRQSRQNHASSPRRAGPRSAQHDAPMM